MRAGKLKHRVQIERYTEARDTTTGELDESWNVVDTVWANVRPLLGRERFQAQQVKADITDEVSIRYYPGITSKDRIRHNDRLLLIEAVFNVAEETRETRILCREQV